jgi:hypothetical protein
MINQRSDVKGIRVLMKGGFYMTITVRQAQLETVQVDVHALRVGHKQMTQSVFRQLRPEHPVDYEKEELRGDLWGTVNYFWKGCSTHWNGQVEHLHLIWQLGDELRRCCIYPPDRCRERANAIRVQEDFIGNAVQLALFRRVLHDPTNVKRPDERFLFSFPGWSCSVNTEDTRHIDTILEALEMDDQTDWQKQRLAEARTEISNSFRFREELLEGEAVGDDDQIAMFVQKCRNKIDGIKENYDVFYQLVLDLPQLFIAV